MDTVKREDWESDVKKKFNNSAFCYTNDGTLIAKVMAPKGSGFLEITLDECDKDLANDGYWRVNWVNGYPYVVSRSAHERYGSMALTHLIAERKYGTRQFGTLTFRNKNRLDFTRHNIVSAEERETEHKWIAALKVFARVRRKASREAIKSAAIQERKAKWEAKVAARKAKAPTKAFKVRRYLPNETEIGFDAWIGAFQIRPERWQPWIKTPQNLDPFNPVPMTTTFNTEQTALKTGYGLWLPYVETAEYAKAREYAKAKLAPEAEKLVIDFSVPTELSGIDS